ncbi:MAG: sigma-70 family RNA polymerase sigma factor [Microthrixaceae bacterium]
MSPEVLERARRHDRGALQTVLDALYEGVARVCRRMCGPDEDDAVQQALISIVRGLPDFDGRASLSTWAHRIAVNASLDEIRRRSRRPEPGGDLSDLTAPAHGGDTALTSESDPAELLAEAEVRLEIDAALATLPLDMANAVVLRDLVGMEYAEIAERLDIPIGTVRSRIARGRSRLAGLLGGNRSSPDDVQVSGQ